MPELHTELILPLYYAGDVTFSDAFRNTGTKRPSVRPEKKPARNWATKMHHAAKGPMSKTCRTLPVGLPQEFAVERSEKRKRVLARAWTRE